MIITIDGPSGTGKSTISRLLAKALRFAHFDTGAMYRSVAYGVLKYKIFWKDPETMEHFLKNFSFNMHYINDKWHFIFEGEDISEKIREEAVTSLVSEISALSSVRKKMVELQRSLAEGKDTVFEGRDMGTVVFPNAEVKIFLTAKPEVRAERRFHEMNEKGIGNAPADVSSVMESLNKRDMSDSQRENSPLKIADGAHIIDTSDLSIPQVLEQLIALIKNLLQRTD